MLDQYKDAPRSPEIRTARREALLDQLGWLADEARALAPMLESLPDWALDQAPLPNERTAKETLSELAELDRTVYSSWISTFVSEDRPELEKPSVSRDESANTRPITDLLVEVAEARFAFEKVVRNVPEEEWSREAVLDGEEVDLFDIVLHIVRHDADRLRDLAYRLHEAKLTDRPHS